MGAFILLIVIVLMIDLLWVGKNSHVVSTKEAFVWSGVWIGLALLFYLFLLYWGHLLHGIDNMEHLLEVKNRFSPGLKFRSTDYEGMLRDYRQYMSLTYISGYFIEKTLSIDNIFVILLILRGFSVPLENYKTVLFWGVLGAVVLRFIFIFAGAALIHRFEWILLVFGAFLVFQGGKILFQKDNHHKDPHDYAIVRYLSCHFNIAKEYNGNKFWYRVNQKLILTPLFVVLVLIEFTDLLFAMDSIPAVFSVSLDPFVVFFSNIFAIIGLRALFFLIANMVDKFRFLSIGVSILLIFVGLKLLFHTWLNEIGFTPAYSLYFIGFILVGSVLLSIAIKPKKRLAFEARKSN
ncbi:TerC/Alx family metal homeostasis membrane protein [Mangrovibacterium sp.]|uniref:TerC/Alx family metal homeostasis membrane protein n=1 Tax=Mangrovibacterium sp. TaxID=1961364 RepID=UPI003564B6E8